MEKRKAKYETNKCNTENGIDFSSDSLMTASGCGRRENS